MDLGIDMKRLMQEADVVPVKLPVGLYITVADAAKVMGISKQAINQTIRQERHGILCYKIGQKIRDPILIDLESFATFMTKPRRHMVVAVTSPVKQSLQRIKRAAIKEDDHVSSDSKARRRGTDRRRRYGGTPASAGRPRKNRR